jgi:lysophospholipase L1-like esterase
MGTRPTVARAVPIALALVLLLAAGAEITLRVLGIDRRRPVYYDLPPGVERIKPGTDEDPDLFWVPRDADLPGHLAEIAAYRGKNLVVTLGGSVVASHPSNPGFVERALERATAAGYAVRGVNLAQGGYTTHHSRVLLDRVLATGRAPDLVVLCNGVNDMAGAVGVTHKENARRNHSLARRVLFALNRSRLFALYRDRLLSLRSRATPPEAPAFVPAVPLADFEANVEAIAQRLEAAGRPLVLVSEPRALRASDRDLAPYGDVLARVAARRARVTFVDLRPRFEELRRALGIPFADEDPARAGTDFSDPGRVPYADALFVDAAGHQTERAKDESAAVIFGVLVAKGLLAR